MHSVLKRVSNAVGFLVLGLTPLQAQPNVMKIDATSADEPVKAVAAKLGTAVSPSGHTLGANSQSLLLDGKPWVPVMGELHYSRVPESEWEADILRMKSAGVNIIASYVIWIHHEQDESHFVWTGNKDLRRFIELCAKHGMYVYPRIGPWAHAEVRNGGLPDWVAAQPHTRENDPHYLAEVNTFYQQIGQQMKGLYWKDGGPIVGLQIENEYRATGAGKGSDHIRTLKAMALAAGIDVPFYTVTGWDGAAIPLDTALPVFGGYPDAPWDGSPKALAPPEVYTFRFDNRSSGSMGAIGGSGQGPASAYEGTPFLTAEIGGGIQDTYFRRPVVSPDDLAAILPVMLGSGANMLGYYMFAGGRNPDGGAISLQESQITGYPTDVPVKSYDFQAPISNNGEERASLRRLKLVHYFLNDFGAQLAAMSVHRPSATPSSATDLHVPRLSARTKGDHGFIFFNNYTRGAAMPERRGFQLQLKLPGQAISIPREPITLPSGAYGIWPVNLDLNGVHLVYSTAQLMNRMDYAGETYVFFFAIPGIKPEFLLNAETSAVRSHGYQESRVTGGIKLRATAESGDIVVSSNDKVLHLVVLKRSDAENLWKIKDGHALLLTQAEVFTDQSTTTLQQEADPRFTFSLFGATTPDAKPTGPANGLFQPFIKTVPGVSIQVAVRQTSPGSPRDTLKNGPPVAWRKTSVPLAPDDHEFAKSAHWSLALTGDIKAPQLADVILRVRYEGDVARLRQNDRLLDDDFWNGVPWTIGTKTTRSDPSSSFDLAIVPLPKDYPMFLQIQPSVDPASNHGQVPTVKSVEAIPLYHWKFTER